MTNTQQLIVLSTNNVPTASQNTLNLIEGTGGMTLTPTDNGAVIFSATDGIASGTLFPFAGVPAGDTPGSVFTVPFNLTALVSVFVNGLLLLPSAYTQNQTIFSLNTALETGDSIFVSGWYEYSA